LVGWQRNALAADVVVIPHHGSATSSSTEFVDAVGARHALALVGYQNRFQHPDPLVERRWRQVGSTLWRSDRHGAIEVQSVHSALIVRSQRALNHRYWHRQE
jgi:competence protein ComEC